MAKKYLTYDGLTEYDGLIKDVISDGDASVKSYVDTELDKKANSTHTHDDRYYTESEIDTKIAGINTSITNITNGSVTVKEAEHADSADSATSATTAANAEKLGGQSPSYYAKASDIPTGALADKDIVSESDLDSALAAKVNAASEGNHSHSNKSVLDGITSAKVTAWDSAEENAKTYADAAAAKVKSDLVNGAGTAYDTLLELGNLIDDNKDAIDALEEVAAGKANATHSHAIADVSGLQSALDGKAAASHGTHVTFDSTNKPKMDGTAAFGTSSSVARADHVHPTDTSRASKSEFDAHVATHAPSNAQANVIETIKVNGTALTPSSKAVNITVPTNNNQLTNGAGYLVASDITGKADKSNTYTKAEVDTKTAVDTALSSTSTKPVQNKVVNSAIVTATNAITANTNSITAHNTRIGNLETSVGEFEAITSAEIQALFA